MANPKRILAAALLICLCTAAAPVYADKIYAGLVMGPGVAVVDPATLEAWGEIKTGSGQAMLAKAGDYVFATDYEDSAVRVIDAGTDSFLKSIMVGEGPLPIESTPDGRLVLAGNTLSGGVSVIDASGLRELKRVGTPGGVFSLKVSHDGRRAYAAGNEGRLWVIDLKKLAVVDELKVPLRTYQIALSASGDMLAVNSREDEEVTVYALPGMKVLKKIKAGSHGLVFSPDDGELWHGGPGGTIRVYSFAKDETTAEFGRDCDTNLEMAFSPDGKRLYASPAGIEVHDIYVYDTASKKKAGAIHLKESPRGLLYIEENKE